MARSQKIRNVLNGSQGKENVLESCTEGVQLESLAEKEEVFEISTEKGERCNRNLNDLAFQQVRSAFLFSLVCCAFAQTNVQLPFP